MATLITEDCINCGACEDECPNGAISMGDDIFVIDPQLCTECVGFSGEQMCALACPPDVCVQDPDRIETEEDLFARARKIHPDQADSLTLDASTSHFRCNGRTTSGATVEPLPMQRLNERNTDDVRS